MRCCTTQGSPLPDGLSASDWGETTHMHVSDMNHEVYSSDRKPKKQQNKQTNHDNKTQTRPSLTTSTTSRNTNLAEVAETHLRDNDTCLYYSSIKVGDIYHGPALEAHQVAHDVAVHTHEQLPSRFVATHVHTQDTWSTTHGLSVQIYFVFPLTSFTSFFVLYNMKI